MHVILCFLFILLSFNSLPAQVDPRPSVDASDLRSRVASYEPTQSRRGDAVTMVDPRLRPFYHGVASGDPMERSVVLWTRVTPENGASSVDVEWRIATDVDLKNVVAQGQGTATSAADFCFKVITAEVLQPATAYYYGFTAYGRHSLTGRTRTLAAGSYAHARFAVVTCANYPMGFFNAYGRIAARNDLDAVLHMGDYIYEYDADTSSFGGGIGARLGRMHEPDKELIELADYRARYAQYRLDPDLMRLHQQHAMIHIWDDHESANGSYRDGAENHSPDEGEWSDRKTVSQRVHSEWMPVRRNASDPLYRSFAYGDLVDIAMLDTRLEGRDKQVSGVSASSPQASKDSLNDVNRRMISPTQFAWLQDILENSNARWRLIGSQVLFTPCDSDPVDTTYLFQELGPILSAIIRARINDVQYFFDYAFKGDVWSNYRYRFRRPPHRHGF
jgi:alkaline phosphatase D